MKKISKGLLLPIVLLSVLSSCGGGGSDNVDYIPVQTTEDGAWHFINSKGEIVGNQEWEFEPTVAIDGIFTVRTSEGTYSVYKWSGKEAKPIDSLQNLVSVGVYSEGLIPVTPSMQRIRIVNGKGDVKFILEPKDGQEITSCSGVFKEGLLIVTNMESKSGVVNKNGDWVVDPKYSDISEFSDGYALASIYDDDGISYFVLDKEGKEIKVEGKFGYPEGECGGNVPFIDGVTTVWSVQETNDGDYESLGYEINTKGEVKKLSNDNNSYSWTEPLENGGKVTYSYKDDHSSSVWTDAKGNVVKEVSQDGTSLTANGKFVTMNSQNSLTLFSEDGKELNRFDGNMSVMVVGGKFGLVLMKYGENYNVADYIVLSPEGQPLTTPKLYGVGLNKCVNDIYSEEEMCGGYYVTSAYVDVTAAASKIASMITNGVTGKSTYYIGESVKNILEGQSVQYMSGKEFSIPTAEDTYYLATGAGFYINGRINASTNIVAPTYKEYFEVHHYDSWGNAWGWNRKKQVGVHVNPSAKVVSFDIQLHTNHPSGQTLREAVGRRLKKEGYTLVASGDNFDEYSNNYREAIIYAAKESNGIGVLIGEPKNLKMSNSSKESLAANLY